MSEYRYLALTDACKNDPALALFIWYRIENIGNARDYPDGREFEVFADPYPEDVDELVHCIRHEAGLAGHAFRHSRAMAARALAIMGL
jgi:hypothetical protein